MDLFHMWAQMGWIAKGVAFVLFIMSFWSVGVAVERIYTFSQARKQSKLYAPQVAKHLKEGRLKEAIALSQSKQYRYSHLAKVVLAGLQEYQFQHDSAGGEKLNREDLLDTVRRAIQRREMDLVLRRCSDCQGEQHGEGEELPHCLEW
jgi:biopolymer transport protein ExbB/biopolymer transport protein TolQ